MDSVSKTSELHIYLGAAPRVGKTCRLLDDDWALKHERGMNVLIGLVETHGRKETAARIRDLEIIPCRAVNEPDVAAILARQPQWVVVDELFYANEPGGVTRTRCEDIVKLLDAGISVATCVNVEHLERQSDSAKRTPPGEFIPDSFLRRATKIVYIDITVQDLQKRLWEKF